MLLLTLFHQSGWKVLGMCLKNEVVREEHVTKNGVDVDEDDGQHGGEQDGDDVPGDAPHDVLQRLFTIHYVKHLRNGLNERYTEERKKTYMHQLPQPAISKMTYQGTV